MSTEWSLIFYPIFRSFYPYGTNLILLIHQRDGNLGVTLDRMKGNGKTAKCRHLHPDTIVVVHAPQHLPKIIRVDLIWDPREVLDTVSWSPWIWFYRIWLEICWQIVQQDKNIARIVHLLTCSWPHRESAWSRCCLFWPMWSNRRWMSSLSCLSHCSQTRHTLGRRRQVFWE